MQGPPPDPKNPADGCRFHPRCPYAIEACRTGDQPAFEAVGGDGGHEASCIYYGEEYDENVLDGDGVTVEGDGGVPAGGVSATTEEDWVADGENATGKSDMSTGEGITD